MPGGEKQMTDEQKYVFRYREQLVGEDEGFLLSGFGYVSGIGAEQSGTAIRGIVLSSSLIPAMIFGMGVAALCFYPITKKYNEQMQAELADRRSKADY